jgi:nucleoside-diphosphate-sugar epimerase
MKKISILGCGWLGLPLAKSLVDLGYEVKGSTTTLDKVDPLRNEAIIPYLIHLAEDAIKGDIDLFLAQSEILIIDIPPKLRGDYKENFVGKIQTLIPYIEKSTIEQVLFISSTSVYPDNDTTSTEDSIPHPDSESGIQLLASERILQTNSNFKTTVIRFGGLIGQDRHPIKLLAGRKNIGNPNAPINMIHQDDCIGIIQKIITTTSWGKTFNAVAPFHPSRKEYYIQKAIEYGLPIPEFDESQPSIGKLILSTKIEAVLDYTFKKAHP